MTTPNALNIPLNLTPDSSQLHGYGYDPASETLAVEYKSNHATVTYHYKGVSQALAETLDAAESKGSVIYRLIKPTYAFERITKAPPPEAADGAADSAQSEAA